VWTYLTAERGSRLIVEHHASAKEGAWPIDGREGQSADHRRDKVALSAR
jgi:hypothetical protein